MQALRQNILRWDLKYTGKIRIAPFPKWRWQLATFFAHTGDSWWCLLALGLLWLIGADQWRLIAASMGIGTFFLAIFIILLKFSIKRRRPDGEWGGIYRNTDPHSFPSGHATRVFFLASMAWVIAPVWFAVALTIWAPLVALSRVMTGVHYIIDVLAGIFLGWVLGKIAVLFVPFLIHLLPFIF